MDLKDELNNAFDKLKKEANILAGKEGRDKEYKSEQEYPSVEEAVKMYIQAKVRLFDVNRWSEISFPGLASFTICNKDGNNLEKKKIEVGDYIKIDLPGPVPHNWVKVTDVQDHDNHAWFTVHPSEQPGSSPETTDHFFSSEATSTFKVERIGNKIFAYEIGRKEVINKGDEAGDRKVINTLVAEGGWLGYQSLQWKALTDYLVGILK